MAVSRNRTPDGGNSEVISGRPAMSRKSQLRSWIAWRVWVKYFGIRKITGPPDLSVSQSRLTVKPDEVHVVHDGSTSGYGLNGALANPVADYGPAYGFLARLRPDACAAGLGRRNCTPPVVGVSRVSALPEVVPPCHRRSWCVRVLSFGHPRRARTIFCVEGLIRVAARARPSLQIIDPVDDPCLGGETGDRARLFCSGVTLMECFLNLGARFRAKGSKCRWPCQSIPRLGISVDTRGMRVEITEGEREEGRESCANVTKQNTNGSSLNLSQWRVPGGFCLSGWSGWSGWTGRARVQDLQISRRLFPRTFEMACIGGGSLWVDARRRADIIFRLVA